MTKFILIRHGLPDYSSVIDCAFKGHGLDLAFLSSQGRQQAQEVAKKKELKDAEILLSSPYTRCMQTASIISNELNLPIIGEINLHEWISDLSYNNDELKSFKINYLKAIEDYTNNQITSTDYESIYNVQIRVLKVLKKYLQYKKVLVVTHGAVMFSLTNNYYSYCETQEIKYDGKALIK